MAAFDTKLQSGSHIRTAASAQQSEHIKKVEQL
jgi:hypothetical protein